MAGYFGNKRRWDEANHPMMDQGNHPMMNQGNYPMMNQGNHHPMMNQGNHPMRDQGNHQMMDQGYDGGYMQQDWMPSQPPPMSNSWQMGGGPPPPIRGLFEEYMQESYHNQYVPNRALDWQSDRGRNEYEMPDKIRRLDMRGNFPEQRGWKYTPRRNSYKQDVTPKNYKPKYQKPNLKKRLGNTDKSKSFMSRYYPSDYGRKKQKRQYRPTHRGQRSRTSKKNSGKEVDKNNVGSKEEDTKTEILDEIETIQEIKKDDCDEIIDKEVTLTNNKEEASSVQKDDLNEVKTDELPTEDLYCHICNYSNFTSKKTYLRHLKGTIHKLMAETFHEKNAALLEFLTASAKLAEMKRKDKRFRTNGPKELTSSGRIVEKVILKNFLNQGCCDVKIDNLFDYHEHKLGFLHFHKLHEKGMKEKVIEPLDLLGASVEIKDNAIKSAEEAFIENPISLKNIPPYDPKSPIGLNFLNKSVRYKCAICKGRQFTSVEKHSLSPIHYKNVVTALQKPKERKKRRRGFKKGAEIRREDREEKKEAADEDSGSNCSDKNEDSKDKSDVSMPNVNDEDDNCPDTNENYKDEISNDNCVNDEIISLSDKDEAIVNNEQQAILDEEK